MKAVGTCRANIKGFYSEQLLLDKKYDRGVFKILVDDRLVMIIKDGKAVIPYKLSVLQLL